MFDYYEENQSNESKEVFLILPFTTLGMVIQVQTLDLSFSTKIIEKIATLEINIDFYASPSLVRFYFIYKINAEIHRVCNII